MEVSLTNRKCFVWLSIVLVCFAGVAVAETFTWTGNGADVRWSICDSWTGVTQNPDPCYPSADTDDTSIDSDDEQVDLVDGLEVIEDLTLRGEFTFGNDSGAEVAALRVDSLVIVGGSGGATITIQGGAVLEGAHP